MSGLASSSLIVYFFRLAKAILETSESSYCVGLRRDDAEYSGGYCHSEAKSKAKLRARTENSVLTYQLNRIEDVNKHCLNEFRKHWTCLDNNNQQLWQCRPDEWKLNKCVFDNLVRSSSL